MFISRRFTHLVLRESSLSSNKQIFYLRRTRPDCIVMFGLWLYRYRSGWIWSGRRKLGPILSGVIFKLKIFAAQ